MARVILITSRDIGRVINKLQREILEVEIVTNLENQFFNNSIHENGTGLLYTVFEGKNDLEFENDYNVFFKVNYWSSIYNQYYPLSTGKDILEKQNLNFRELSSDDKKKILSLIGNLIASKVYPKYNNIESFIGKLKYLKEDNTFIFFAYEFPHDIYVGKKNYYPKAKYLEALITDIEVFLKEQGDSVDEWLFINHDYDWFNESKGSRRIKTYYPVYDEPLLEPLFKHSSKLSEIYKLHNFELIVYSHGHDGRIWIKLLSCLDDSKINELANENIINIVNKYV